MAVAFAAGARASPMVMHSWLSQPVTPTRRRDGPTRSISPKEGSPPPSRQACIDTTIVVINERYIITTCIEALTDALSTKSIHRNLRGPAKLGGTNLQLVLCDAQGHRLTTCNTTNIKRNQKVLTKSQSYSKMPDCVPAQEHSRELGRKTNTLLYLWMFRLATRCQLAHLCAIPIHSFRSRHCARKNCGANARLDNSVNQCAQHLNMFSCSQERSMHLFNRPPNTKNLHSRDTLP